MLAQACTPRSWDREVGQFIANLNYIASSNPDGLHEILFDKTTKKKKKEAGKEGEANIFILKIQTSSCLTKSSLAV